MFYFSSFLKFSSLYRKQLNVSKYYKLGRKCAGRSISLNSDVSPFFRDQWVKSQQYQSFFTSYKPLYSVVTKMANE